MPYVFVRSPIFFVLCCLAIELTRLTIFAPLADSLQYGDGFAFFR